MFKNRRLSKNLARKGEKALCAKSIGNINRIPGHVKEEKVKMKSR